MEEKVSLSERFGLWVSFYSFTQDEGDFTILARGIPADYQPITLDGDGYNAS